MKTPIWTNQIDGKYAVAVYRAGYGRGELIFSLNGHELSRKAVQITGDARFGIDAQDEDEWIDHCCKVADTLL